MEEFYKNLVQNAIDIIFKTDAEGNFTFANNFTVQELGYSMDEILGTPFTRFIRADFRSSVMRFYGDLESIESDFPSIEFIIIKKDGSEIWVSQKVTLQSDSTGKVLGYIGVIRDITTLKSFEANEKERLKKIERYNTTLNLLSSSNFSKFNLFNQVIEFILKETTIATKTDFISYFQQYDDTAINEVNYNTSLDEIKYETHKISFISKTSCTNLKKLKTIKIPYFKSDYSSFFEENTSFPQETNSVLITGVLDNEELQGILCFANWNENQIWDNEDKTFIRSVTDIITLQLELQLRIETEKKLKYRSHVWSVVSHCTEKYLQSKSPIELFDETFPIIGKATAVDHIYYYENDLKTQQIRQKYKWGKENLPLQITPIQTFTKDQFKVITDTAAEKKPFISSVRNLEDGFLKSILESNNVKSVIIWPLYLSDKFSGFIGFDSCSEERIWTVDEIVIFQVLANNISSLIERSTNERLANESEERFKLLANNIPGTVYLSNYDKDWTKVYLNDQVTSLTGYTKEEFIKNKMSFSDLLHEDDKQEIIALSLATIAQKKPLHLTYRIRTKEGKIKWIEEFADTIKINGNIKFIEGLYIDITQKKESETAIIEKELAQSANKAKSEFLANMSHEIKTPLNGIIGFTDIVMKSELNADQESYMATVHQSANTLLGIIDNILDFSKIEAGKLELDLQPVSMSDLLTTIAQVNRFDLERKNLEFKIKLDPTIPEIVMVDPVRLKQILLNLVSNAIKFTGVGKITLKIKCTKQISSEMQKIRFSVIDTGIGILPLNQKRIFEPFLQEDNSTTRKYGGTGLGLTITNQLLNLMDSKLKVKSKPNKGSKFYFNLFVKANLSVPIHQITMNEPLQEFDTSKLKLTILIAEDNMINMLLIKTILKSFLPKAKLIESHNGLAVIEKFLESVPDLILMDVQMPLLNGLEATKRIRALSENNAIPIIALTAGTLKEDRESCLAAGMNDFVSKPIVKDSIKEVILKWTNSYKK